MKSGLSIEVSGILMVVEIDLVPGNCPPPTELVLGSIIPSS